jgi:hypothetical protein
MQHDPFSPQQEFAQAYQLGLLEGEYVLDPKRVLVSLSVLLAPVSGIIVFMRVILGPSISFFPLALSLLVAIGGGIVIYYLFYIHLHVYVYTYGLVYLNGHTRRIVYWQQIRDSSVYKGFLHVSVKNEANIMIPWYLSRFGELRARIDQQSRHFGVWTR